ncbi:MAG: DUF6048 family protein [Cyclobacteriaceae bacterium]
MMRKFLLFFISILLSGLSVNAQDVENESDTTALIPDSVKVKAPLLSGISLTADIGKLITGQLSEFEDKEAYSFHILLLDKIRVSAEYGEGTITPLDAFQNVDYRSEGYFYNYGLSYVVSPKLNNYISLGVRRGQAEYSDEGIITIISDSELSGDYRRSFNRESLSATWYEFIISSETRLFKEKSSRKKNAFNNLLGNFYLGTNFRLRFSLDYESQDNPDIYTIPGYGRTFDKTVPVVNLFLKYRIGFSR